jgi:hypothetical protein
MNDWYVIVGERAGRHMAHFFPSSLYGAVMDECVKGGYAIVFSTDPLSSGDAKREFIKAREKYKTPGTA